MHAQIYFQTYMISSRTMSDHNFLNLKMKITVLIKYFPNFKKSRELYVHFLKIASRFFVIVQLKIIETKFQTEKEENLNNAAQ